MLICYSVPYAVSRFVYPETVLKYVGGHVIRPSFFRSSNPATTPDFTFDHHSRSFGSSFLTESFVSQSPVTRLASHTGWDVAGLLNDFYYPIARVDHLFTGRYCRFQNDAWVPLSTKRTLLTQPLRSIFPAQSLPTSRDSTHTDHEQSQDSLPVSDSGRIPNIR